MSEVSESEKKEWLEWVKDRTHLISLYMVSCLKNSRDYKGAVDSNGNVIGGEPNPDFRFLAKCLVKIQERGSVSENDIDRLNSLYKKWKHEFFEVQNLSKQDIIHRMEQDMQDIWEEYEPQSSNEN